MKKLLTVGLLVISASAFAFGGHHYTENGHHYTRIISNDGERTICEVRTSHRMDGRHRDMMRNMPKHLSDSLEKTRIEISQRKLNIRRLFLEDPVDWKKVEEENTQIGILQGQMKTKIQRYMMEEEGKPIPKPIHHSSKQPIK